MVEDHRHCMMCGKAIERDKLFCSEACEEVFMIQQRRIRRARILFFFLMTIILGLIFVLSSVRG